MKQQTIGQIVGNNLKNYRENKSLSQDKLSEISGVSQKTIYLIETGKTANPRKQQLNKLAFALEVTIEDFLKMPRDIKNDESRAVMLNLESKVAMDKLMKLMDSNLDLHQRLIAAEKALEESDDQILALKAELEQLKAQAKR